ncbi:hypothetical protein R3W88_027149 [Solanum pinnatisectum]|uniref:Uncharacterized protein n=1 Tax=Solanum pinnatisectum TaxID=50273 RepID=A0AAV9LIN7_9SOLN|nr:hypothetical protein R3W88_027149 [Solanum pinnatisectum]
MTLGSKEVLFVPGTEVQEGLLVPLPEVQLIDNSGKSLADASKTSDKVQGYQEGDACVISSEDQSGLNAGQVLDRNSITTQQLNCNATEKESTITTWITTVGGEPANTSNNKIELQEKTTNSKVFVVASQVTSRKLLTGDVTINTDATYMVPNKRTWTV